MHLNTLTQQFVLDILYHHVSEYQFLKQYIDYKAR